MSSPYGSHFDGAAWPWTLHSDDDWHVLFDAHMRYVSDACVEGSGDEWRAISAALRNGESESFKRCAVRFDGDDFSLYSPRNTCGGAARLSGRDKAVALADIIDAALDDATIARHDAESP
jgi:hypothetical protein